MQIKDKVYKFEFFQTVELGAEPEKRIYSDTDNIYELNDVPKLCVLIKCFYKDINKRQDWKLQNCYFLGDEITTEEAKEEYKKLKNLEFTSWYTNVRDETLGVLKSYCDQNPIDKIYLNKNIPLNEKSIRNRLIIASWWSNNDIIYLSPKQIIEGKIYPRDPYLELE